MNILLFRANTLLLSSGHVSQLRYLINTEYKMYVKKESEGDNPSKTIGGILRHFGGGGRFIAENIHFCLNDVEPNRCSLTFRTSVLLPSSVPPLSLLE